MQAIFNALTFAPPPEQWLFWTTFVIANLVLVGCLAWNVYGNYRRRQGSLR